MKIKKCSQCKECKLFTQFNMIIRNNKNIKPYTNYMCKLCERNKDKERRQEPQRKKQLSDNNKKHRMSLKGRFGNLKHGSLRRKIDCNINFNDFENLHKLPCYYCNDLLNNDIGCGHGLDRIDNSKGYTLDNVLKCCGFCNAIRRDRLSVNEMKNIANMLISDRNLGEKL